VQRRRRIAAYGLCRDGEGRVLLVRAGPRSHHHRQWLLPGGGVDHGEHPAAAAVREIQEETGLATRIVAVRDVVSDVLRLDSVGVLLHHDRIIYDVALVGGTLRDETEGTTDAARWVSTDEVANLPLMAFTAAVLGLPATPLAHGRPDPIGPDAALADQGRPGPAAEHPPPARQSTTVDSDAPRNRRFAVYGLVTDPSRRVLLAQIAPGYPAAGRWHLPGGGTDFGEQPVAALLRELAEETDQAGVVTRLLTVTHRHNPRALGPEGVPIDWHTVRALYRVRVELATEARVVEANGSTARAGWFTRADALLLPLTEVAREALQTYWE
jgi:8-oxo-dGTP diphosphatase